MLKTLFAQKGSNKAASELNALLPGIRQHAERMRFLNDRHLMDAASAVRESFAQSDEADFDETVSAALALSVEALRRTRGVELYDVQLMAALAIAQGDVAEMGTGEGKTFAVFPGAVISSLRGNRNHIATPNAYLAQRDLQLLVPAYEVLGLSAGLLGDHNASPEDKRAAYSCDVVYGTGFDFGFDFLRDQAAARYAPSNPLGRELLEKLRGHPQAGRTTMQRGHQVAIVDEVDHVLLDDAGSPLILCDAPDGEAEDAEACRLAKRLVRNLLAEEHFRIWNDTNVYLTGDGLELIHSSDISIPVKQLRRPWAEYVQQALRAELVFRRDVHYIVDDQEIKIIDGSTGRIYSDRSWNDGLHQAMEAKEGVLITSERSALAQITRQRYFRMYRHLAGTTGTAVGCEAEFKTIYGLDVRKIPLRLPCRRTVMPTRVFAAAEGKWRAIIEDVNAIHREGRPILIATRTIRDSELLADRLQSQGLPFQMLNGKQDAEEADVIAGAGAKGAITIATNMAGRGTDIQLPSMVKALGGLHVVISEPNELERVDRQLIGRSARQGDPGSARTYVSAEDTLLSMYGSWLTLPIRRGAQKGELRMDITKRLRSVQQMVERKRAAARQQLMKRDLARESLLSGLSGNS